MFVSVCNSLYLSICLYLFICSYLCTSLRSSSQGSNSQQQSATVHKQSSSHGSHGCLFISVYTFISVHICLYQTFICTYMHIFVHICIYLFISAYICAYLCISVYIQKLHCEGKKPNFQKKRFLVLNPFSKQAGLSAPQKSKIPMSASGIDPKTFQCHATALTTWLALLCISSI